MTTSPQSAPPLTVEELDRLEQLAKEAIALRAKVIVAPFGVDDPKEDSEENDAAIEAARSAEDDFLRELDEEFILRLTAAARRGMAVDNRIVEEVAKIIYAQLPYVGHSGLPLPGRKPAWQEHGNSDKQNESRRLARIALEAALSADRVKEEK